MASPMDLDIRSSPIYSDPDDDLSCSVSISSDFKEVNPGPVIEDQTPLSIPPSANKQYCAYQGCSTNQPLHSSHTPASGSHGNKNPTTSPLGFTGTESISSQEIYQTRWTFECEHMVIHDDKDPLYPSPHQLHKVSTEQCPMCKELQAIDSRQQNTERKSADNAVLDPITKDFVVTQGIIKEDSITEGEARMEQLSLTVLQAQRDEVLRYAQFIDSQFLDSQFLDSQFLDSSTGFSNQAWEWYDVCNKNWARKVWEVEKHKAKTYPPGLPLPATSQSRISPSENFGYIQAKADLMLEAHCALLGREDGPIEGGGLTPDVRAEILRRCRFFHDLGKAVDELWKSDKKGCQARSVTEACLKDVWKKFVGFVRKEE